MLRWKTRRVLWSRAASQDLQEILTWGENVQDTGKGLSIWCFYWGNSKIMWPKNIFAQITILCFKSNLGMVWFYGGMVQALKITKSAVHIMSSSGHLDHCRPLFRELGIMTMYGQYIMVSLAYVKNKLESFTARGMSISKTPEDWLHWKYQPAGPPSLRQVFLSWLWRFLISSLPSEVQATRQEKNLAVFKSWLVEVACYL